MAQVTKTQIAKAYTLFDAEPRGAWLTANIHTINTMKYYLGAYVRYGDEDLLASGVAHYYKAEQVPGIVNRIKRIAASAR